MQRYQRLSISHTLCYAILGQREGGEGQRQGRMGIGRTPGGFGGSDGSHALTSQPCGFVTATARLGLFSSSQGLLRRYGDDAGN